MTEARMVPFERLLEVENTPDLMALTCPYSGLPIWPAIRVWVIRMLIEDTSGESQVAKSGEVPRYRRHQCAAQAALNNLRRAYLKAPIMYVATGVTNVMVDGKYINRISDPLYSCFPKNSIVAEWNEKWIHLRPRIHERVLYLSDMEWKQFLHQKIDRSQPVQLMRDTVELVAARAKKVLDCELSESIRQRIGASVAEFCARAATQCNLWCEFLRQRETTFLVLENGFYGLFSPVVHAARKLGIQVAEMQHGFVSSSHEAYNVAPAIRESEAYRASMPDYFLTWGQWWIEQIRISATCIPIGNPWLTQRLAQTTDADKTQILIASIGLDFPRELKLATAVREASAGRYDVRIRPHPDERAHILEAYPDVVDSLDLEPDLFRSLKRSAFVISEFSTVLFEALAAGCRVLVWDTPATRFRFPDCPFETFREAAELVSVFAGSDGIESPPVDSASFWTTNPEERYREFVRSLGILS